MPRAGASRGKRRRPRPPALETAVRLLAARPLTVRETRDRLALRGYSTTEVVSAIDSLLSRGYLDDRGVAYNAASSLASRRKFGRARIAAELKRRGIQPGTITEALDHAFAEVDEEEQAWKAACKGAERVPGPPGDRERERLARSLLRRGFSRVIVSRVLARLGAAGREGDMSPGSRYEDEDGFSTDP